MLSVQIIHAKTQNGYYGCAAAGGMLRDSPFVAQESFCDQSNSLYEPTAPLSPLDAFCEGFAYALVVA